MSFGVSVADFATIVQLSSKARKQFVNAPDEFKALKDEIKGLSNVLRNFEDSEDLVSAQDLESDRQSRLEDAIKGCTEVLQDLNKVAEKYSKLDKAQGKSNKIQQIWKRLEWEPQDVSQLRSRLTSNLLILDATYNDLLRNVSFHVKDGVDRLNRQQKEQERQSLMNWLAPADFSNQHSDVFSRRQEGTGEWLLSSKEYIQWRTGMQRLLLCPGIPGAGKTTMSSVIVNDLWKHFDRHADHVVAYAYCSYQRQHEQTLANLLSTMLRQLLQERPDLPYAFQRLHQRHLKKNTRPSVEELWTLLQSVTKTYSKVCIVIDALDECTNVDRTRNLLLDKLFRLQNQSETVVCVLATTRFVPEILDLFKHHVTLEIRANDHDVRKYLDSHISRLAPSVARKNDLQEEIKTKIIEAVDGMFLLAQLHFDSLIDKTTPKKIRTALQQMRREPEALESAYKSTVERIKCQQRGFRDLAQKVLSWITYSRRPLTIMELQHALAADFGDRELDPDNIEDEDLIVSVCAGLITVDDESKVIRFIHYTTQEFFENVEKEWLSNAQLNMSMSCIAYLSFDTFASGWCSTDELFALRLEENPFLDYAARYWGHHASYVETQIVNSLLSSFLTKESNTTCAVQAMFAKQYGYLGTKSRDVPQHPTAIHLLAIFGLSECIVAFLGEKYEPDLKDSYGQTPLSWVAQRGHESVVKLLLARDDMEADSKDNKGRTPLSWAAERGHETIVKLLLARGDVEADSKDERGQTPLSWAARRGHETIVKLLLARDDVDADSRDNIGQTSLSWAAEKGHKAIVELLLARDDVKADSRDDRGLTPLSWAAEGGHEIIANLILARDKLKG